MTMPAIFTYHESREMIHYSPTFVLMKVVNYSLIFLLLAMIPTILIFLFQSSFIYVSLYGLACIIIAVLVNISIKYSSFTCLQAQSYSQNIASIFTMILCIPGGILIVVFYGIWKYFNAKMQMQKLYA